MACPRWTLAKQEGEPGEDHSERPNQGRRLEGAPGPSACLLLFSKREHGGDKPRGGFPVGANGSGTSSHGHHPLRGVRRTTGILRRFPAFALKQELFLGALQERLKTSLLPEGEDVSEPQKPRSGPEAPWTTRA